MNVKKWLTDWKFIILRNPSNQSALSEMPTEVAQAEKARRVTFEFGGPSGVLVID